MTSFTYAQAAKYVGTDRASGASQLTLLMSCGLRPDDDVIEVGCGALHLARPLLAYLDVARYVGVDPNEWLRLAALRDDPNLIALVAQQQPFFSSRDDFDTGVRNCADWVFAHSVLSHAAHWQLPQFLEGAASMLRRGGRLLASLRLSMVNSNSDGWEYPGATHFTMETVEDAVGEAGFSSLEWRPDLRVVHTATCPDEFHDWMLVTR